MLPDPVEAYDRIAPEFARLAGERRAYLQRIDELVTAAIPPGARALLDIGAGDGSRAVRIAAAAGIANVTLLDPSAAMRARWPQHVTAWPMRAEDLSAQHGQFDAIICLWNVLGHIFPAAARVEALRQAARLLSPGGRLLLDVNHRYNARHYGFARTALRFLRDFAGLAPHGDVVVTWTAGGAELQTLGHVFTGFELRRLFHAAGLETERRFVIDYATGELCRRSYQGHLLFVLKRAVIHSNA